MNIKRYIVLCFQRNHTYKHTVFVSMIGQSKINTFFKRQSSSSEDRLQTAGNDDTSERTLSVKRKRDENILEVVLLH